MKKASYRMLVEKLPVSQGHNLEPTLTLPLVQIWNEREPLEKPVQIVALPALNRPKS
jgi:hypothetical protein